MSAITLPSQFKPASCSLTQYVSQRVNASPFGGSEQAIDLLNDRWLLTCELPNSLTNSGAWIEAFIGSMRGQTNTVALHHFARPYPIGTVRGTLTASSAAQGAASLTITGCSPSNGTLLAGDMLGVSGLLLMVAADATASGGSITVTLANRLRKAVSGSVTWSKPTATFRLLSNTSVSYTQSVASAVTFDFGEKI